MEEKQKSIPVLRNTTWAVFYIFIVVAFIPRYTFVKTLQTIMFKVLSFIVYKLYLNTFFKGKGTFKF